MCGGAGPPNTFVHGLLYCLALIRDPFQPHEAAEITLEFLGDIQSDLPHGASRGSSDTDRNSVVGEYCFNIFLHQARGIVIHDNFVKSGSYLNSRHAVGRVDSSEVFEVLVA
jgi:hypothetical protein